MAASSSSNTPTVKQSSLSYAERARRAGASGAPSRAPVLARNPRPNGKTRSGDESTSPASSSRNLTPNSSAALTLPGSPPPSSSQTSIDEPQTLPYIPKSPSKPTQPNVWAARKEQQMVRAAVQQHGHASAPVQAENSSQTSSTATHRLPTNGVNVLLQSDELMNAESDPFVVRMPAQGPGRERSAVSTAFRTPPSLDDSESWPEMGKGGRSASTSVPASIVDLDKKEGSSKKGEKPKWVQIPPAELQATHDAIAAQSQANSRAQSQHRRNSQAKSRSRQQSQARSTHSQNRNQSQNQNVTQGLSNGTGGFGLKYGDASTAHSRTESTTHSRTTSIHSSPRIPTRGRRLPEEHPPMPNLPSGANAGPSTSSKRPPNGLPEESVLSPPPPENQNIAHTHPIYHDNNAAYMAPPQPLSGPHSQSHTPYSHSPVYYPPPPSSGSQGYGYGPIPPGSAYGGPPQPIPSPGMHQQGYMGYPPYGIPQHLPPGQPPFPYMYQPVPYPYYPSQMPVQQQETRPQQEEPQQGAAEGTTHLSPVLPPTSTLTRPPPPEESAALSGYRAISTIAVSPLLTASEPGQSISQVAEAEGEVLFGSVGQPGGMKSPSPAPLLSAASNVQDAKTLTAFAVGFDGITTIRRKRTASAKDSVDEVTEAVKVIDLTDKESKWKFGTSAQPEVEGRSNEEETAYGTNGQSQAARLHQEQMDSQILQPQPQHMLHYPPPNGPPTIQVGGYNMAPQMHMHMSSLPMPTQSPQGGGQPLPSHLPSLAPMPINPGFVSPLTLSSPGPGGPMHAMHVEDEWEVRDFGYGFGPTSGSGYMPERMREERFEREGYRDSRDNFREPRDFGGGGFGSGRMRRNSIAGGYGAGYYEGGRGGFAGRRGRGQNGFGRGFGRGGFGGRGGHGNFRHQPSLSVSTTFQHQQGMQQQHPQMSPEVPNGYYAPPSTATAQFMSSPYGQYNPGLPPPQSQPQLPPPQSLPQSQPSQQAQPPVPMPVTTLSFPLDPIRLYLLGQLEYYFSIQNLASDLFLRKQMDSRGWLPIHLIASFNRVRQLTQDPQLVNEVLNLSSLVEVRGEHVRLSNAQWENFVLPSAAASTVEGEQVVRAQPAPAGASDRETPEEEEEDDVVFVLGGEESRPWTGAS